MPTATQEDIDTQSALAALAALADPTRLAIIGLLRRRDHCVCHLVEVLELKQSAISHHIGILRRAGLIHVYPHATDRRWLYYGLNREVLLGLAGRLAAFADAAEFDPVPLPCAADTEDWKSELAGGA